MKSPAPLRNATKTQALLLAGALSLLGCRDRAEGPPTAELVSLLKQSSSIEDALKVHQELANVRTEIDRLEGRQRFIESESAMAKILLTLEPARPIVGFSGAQLVASVRQAATDAVSIAGGLLTFVIRAAGVLLPLTLLGAPLFMALRVVRRRRLSAPSA